MPEYATNPVFIFLPVAEAGPVDQGVYVDPVCGRPLSGGTIAGRLLHRGSHHYFCSLSCAQRFAADPEEFSL
jgi:P-type Cu+ transporter